MIPLTADEILASLKQPLRPGQAPPLALDLLTRYHYDLPEYASAWDADPHGPRLYRWFTRKLISQGYPTNALKLARRYLDKDAKAKGIGTEGARPEATGDPILRYLIGLAFARGGNLQSAIRYVRPLVELTHTGLDWPGATAAERGDLTAEVLALYGRVHKDHARLARPGEVRKGFARQAAELYLQAANHTKDNSFQLGNAACLRYVQGEANDARELASRAYDQAMAEAAASPTSYWPVATAAEMCLILGKAAEARTGYERVVSEMLQQRERGALAALLPNIRLLGEAGLKIESDWITSRIGGVVAFSGHRVDPPWFTQGGKPSQFPSDHLLAKEVKARIGEELDRLNVRFGFCSLACGADILFAEAMLERRADLQVVLPFAKQDFRRLSVDYGLSGPEWVRWATRFEWVLAELSPFPDAVYYATDEPYLGSERLFGYANEVLQGMTIVRARQLGVLPQALIVHDPAAPPTPGGAAHFKELWAQTGNPTNVIDLSALRGDLMPVAALPTPEREPQPVLPRPVRAMLFADVAGFSKMKEELAPEFFQLFPQIVADALAAAGGRLLVKNTWGDGVFAVFGAEPDGTGMGEASAAGVVDAADTALRLIAGFEASAPVWARMGFHDVNPIRVGLHAGPVFELAHDPVLGRMNYVGQHVNRTARIEPITLPGSAFASEQFAALLTVAAPNVFGCEFVGVEPLAKNYATAPLYQIFRRPTAPEEGV